MFCNELLHLPHHPGGPVRLHIPLGNGLALRQNRRQQLQQQALQQIGDLPGRPGGASFGNLLHQLNIGPRALRRSKDTAAVNLLQGRQYVRVRALNLKRNTKTHSRLRCFDHLMVPVGRNNHELPRFHGILLHGSSRLRRLANEPLLHQLQLVKRVLVAF